MTGGRCSEVVVSTGLTVYTLINQLIITEKYIAIIQKLDKFKERLKPLL
jgi:hypothetical protein